MKTSVKILIVAGGYVAAFLAASAVVAIRVANTSGPDALASSGMYAAGDSMLFVAMFGVGALVPTGFALFFLRSNRRFWIALATLSVIVAATGVTAAVLYALGRSATASTVTTLAALSVLRILLAPLLALTFFVATFFSPHRSPRLALLAAAATELTVSAYGAFVWFIPMLLQGR